MPVTKLGMTNISKRGNDHKVRKAYSKFIRRHYELISKHDNGLKYFCYEPEFYGVLVYKFGKHVGKFELSDHFSKIVICYK